MPRAALRAWYCTQAEISSPLPDGHGYTSDQLDAINERAADWVDGELSQRFHVPFPDVAANPSTPLPVRDVAMIYALWYGQVQLAPSDRNITDAELQEKRKFLDAEIAKLMDSSTDAPKIGALRKTGEVIALGTWNGNTIGDYWHAFACSPCDVLEESVIVTNAAGTYRYQNGYDFQCRYRPELRGWVLQVSNTDIVAGFLVSYSYDHYRRTEKPTPVSQSGTIELS
jgi:hypothetical protein